MGGRSHRQDAIPPVQVETRTIGTGGDAEHRQGSATRRPGHPIQQRLVGLLIVGGNVRSMMVRMRRREVLIVGKARVVRARRQEDAGPIEVVRSVPPGILPLLFGLGDFPRWMRRTDPTPPQAGDGALLPYRWHRLWSVVTTSHDRGAAATALATPCSACRPGTSTPPPRPEPTRRRHGPGRHLGRLGWCLETSPGTCRSRSRSRRCRHHLLRRWTRQRRGHPDRTGGQGMDGTSHPTVHAALHVVDQDAAVGQPNGEGTAVGTPAKGRAALGSGGVGIGGGRCFGCIFVVVVIVIAASGIVPTPAKGEDNVVIVIIVVTILEIPLVSILLAITATTAVVTIIVTTAAAIPILLI
mmetsp:Transcript_28959/g.84113  ORF Transcript_28959/g.84113 Transcript_28959/m.84113 type:complete len:355 (-) Transcript_28959:440-1504(-)